MTPWLVVKLISKNKEVKSVTVEVSIYVNATQGGKG
jgi:hypothetical protein